MTKKQDKSVCLAEIVESSLTHFVAQSWQWNSCAPFGSLIVVATQTRTIFGIVHQIHTGSLEPGRYPFTYQKTEEELLAEQPQIFEFLKTTFHCVVVGFQEHEIMYHQLPPEPPKIHAFVGLATAVQYKQFFTDFHFLHLLFAASGIEHLDELILAVLHNSKKQHIVSEEKIVDLLELYSLLIGNDYKRLKLLVNRIGN